MFTESTSFRPRNGKSAESYWMIRRWCEQYGFTFSDAINPLLIPVAYYLNNFCVVEPERSMATVELNIGKIAIMHVFGGKCYPLASQKSGKSFSIPEIDKRIAYWQHENATNPQPCDADLAKAV